MIKLKIMSICAPKSIILGSTLNNEIIKLRFKIISIANKNKTLSDAHKNKISNGLRGKYTGCETGETFVSIRTAQHEYNVTTITKCLNGKCKTAGNLNGMKLHWVYKS